MKKNVWLILAGVLLMLAVVGHTYLRQKDTHNMCKQIVALRMQLDLPPKECP